METVDSQNEVTIGFKEPAFAEEKMSIISSFDPDRQCPPAYGDCTCTCHSIPDCVHVMACCWPGRRSFSDLVTIEPLGQPFEDILIDNLPSLYEIDEKVEVEKKLQLEAERQKTIDDVMKLVIEYSHTMAWQTRMMGTHKGYEVERKGKEIRELLGKLIK